MHFLNLTISDFRSFSKYSVSFSPKVTVIFGQNASGKTNIIESIYLLSSGKSFRASLSSDMISHKKEIARVSGDVLFDGTKTSLEVMLTRGSVSRGAYVERVSTKKFLVNGVSRRLVDFVGKLPVTLFSPIDVDLVTGSPTIRREFLDFVLGQTDIHYRKTLLSYEKGVRARNRLLKRIRDEGVSSSQLLFWNSLLLKNGEYLSSARQVFFDFVNKQESISNDKFSLSYLPSKISPKGFEDDLPREIAAATTLHGPHRDDFTFMVQRHGEDEVYELSRYASRGEQRMGILWLKYCELSFLESHLNERPLLLLDDVFSELDVEHKEYVVSLCTRQQTIITTADSAFSVDLPDVVKIDFG